MGEIMGITENKAEMHKSLSTEELLKLAIISDGNGSNEGRAEFVRLLGKTDIRPGVDAFNFLKEGNYDNALNDAFREIIEKYYEITIEKNALSREQWNTLRGDLLERIRNVEHRIREFPEDRADNEIDLLGKQRALEKLRLREPKLE